MVLVFVPRGLVFPIVIFRKISFLVKVSHFPYRIVEHNSTLVIVEMFVFLGGGLQKSLPNLASSRSADFSVRAGAETEGALGECAQTASEQGSYLDLVAEEQSCELNGHSPAQQQV